MARLAGSSAEEPRSSWPTSFVELYRAQYAPMVRLAYLLTGSNALAEEVVQEAFVRVRGHLAEVNGPVGYLRTTVVNGCKNLHRRSAVERRYLDSGRRDLVAEAVADATDELADALGALPYRQRAVVVLRYYLDLSEAEIAEVLGCRPGTVKSLAHRALAELRRSLG